MKIEFIAQLALLLLVVVTQIRLRRQQKIIADLREEISEKLIKNSNLTPDFVMIRIRNPNPENAGVNLSFPKKELPTLEELLNIAVENENYELAKVIHEVIKKRDGKN